MIKELNIGTKIEMKQDQNHAAVMQALSKLEFKTAKMQTPSVNKLEIVDRVGE